MKTTHEVPIIARFLLIGSLLIGVAGCADDKDRGTHATQSRGTEPSSEGTPSHGELVRREERRLESLSRRICREGATEMSLEEFAKDEEARSSSPEDIATAVAEDWRVFFQKRLRDRLTALIREACLDGIEAAT